MDSKHTIKGGVSHQPPQLLQYVAVPSARIAPFSHLTVEATRTGMGRQHGPGMDNYSSMDGMKLVMTPVSNLNHAHRQLKTGPGHLMDIQPRHYRTRKVCTNWSPRYWKLMMTP
jgi:hypothetical protein